MTKATRRKYLKRALRLLRGGDGWMKEGYHYRDHDTGDEFYCAIGAVWAAVQGDYPDLPTFAAWSDGSLMATVVTQNPEHPASRVFDEILACLVKAARPHSASDMAVTRRQSTIEDWNDAKSRKFRDVEQAMLTAIEAESC
jgi:hypothetical protein